MLAYRCVRANKGSPGVDGMDFEDIEQKTGIDTFLSELAQDLKHQTYHPSPVRRVMIPKGNGSQRPLGDTDDPRPRSPDGGQAHH